GSGGRVVELRQPCLGRMVVDAGRVELLIDPGGEAHGPDAIQVAGPRAERQAAEDVGDGGVVPPLESLGAP
ncbi:MAG TPA: hypothetical protein VEP46_10965, partial [Vicinamibacterales bacterium]|nr:hypothetical protein [Vicinamibacterales bacterium]